MYRNNSLEKSKNVLFAAGSLLAGGVGDATAISGLCVDTLGYRSLKLEIGYKAILTADKTLSIAAEYQQEELDETAFETAVALFAASVVNTGAGTKQGVIEMDINLDSKKRYFTVNITPNLSHTGTDVAVVWATGTLMDCDTNAVTADESGTTT